MGTRTNVKTAASAERRRAERRRARRLAPGRLTPCVVRGAGAEADIPGWVHNVSVWGVGLVSSRPAVAGEVLNVLLINAPHTFALSVEVRVVRCYRVVSGDYFVGGTFPEPLRHDELLPFMV
jgi:hypothetical protein